MRQRLTADAAWAVNRTTGSNAFSVQSVGSPGLREGAVLPDSRGECDGFAGVKGAVLFGCQVEYRGGA